jgi:hypothetical protein
MSCDLKSKKKNVQFDIVNTTSNPIFYNLFEQGITSTPISEGTIASPPTTLTSTTIGFAQTLWLERNTNTNGYYYNQRTGLVGSVLVKDSDGLTVTSINLTAGLNPLAGATFCPTQNTLFVPDYNANSIDIIDTTTNTLITNLVVGVAPLRMCEYIPSTNEVWVLSTDGANPVEIIDVTTNTLKPTPVFPACQPQDIVYYAPLDIIYIICTFSATIWKIDPVTRNLLLQTATSFANPQSCGIVNDELWVGGIGTNRANIYNTNTDSITSQIVLPNVGTIYRGNWVYVDYWDRVYAYDSTNGFVYGIDTNGIVQETLTAGATSRGFVAVPIINGNTLGGFGGGSTYNYVGTVSSTPLYIGGSSDYNFFVNSLEGQPIKLDCLDIISLNQDQLSNGLTIAKKDADGFSNQKPKFPILDVSAWQEQGNRSSIPMNGLILDGRTFFSNYKINAGETVVFELCYEQLNRFCFAEHPELFTSLKPIAKEEKEKIENKIIERDKKESGDSESKFEIIKDSIVIDISVTNNTANTSTFNFFQANQNQLIVNTPSVNFADVDAYNYLVQQLRDSPLVLNAVEVVSSDQNQLTLPVSVKTDDANGDSITYQHFPINRVGTGQQQGNRVIVKTNHLILDGYTTFASYNILPNTTISFVLYYQQFNRSLFLKKHFFTKLKTPIFDNGMDFAEEIEYFNEVTQNAKNKNSFKNNSKNKEKNINFGTEQVYSVGFNGERTANPFLSISKNKVVDNKKPINQEKYNYRDVKKNNHDGNTYKKNIY